MPLYSPIDPAGWPRDSLPKDAFYSIDPRVLSSTTTVVANRAYIAPGIVGASGTLASIYLAVGTQSGNIDVGIYRYSLTNTRLDKVWSSGSQACPAANDWRNVGSPNLPIFAGEVLYTAVAADNTTATFARTTLPMAAYGVLPVDFYGGSAWNRIAAGFDTSFPLPTTLTAASVVTVTNSFGILGKIS